VGFGARGFDFLEVRVQFNGLVDAALPAYDWALRKT
jgi:hypothetical protein